ncbi:hypothetical protein B4144_0703 [Bacillus atrophaeus]|nr:hypothetical protein B4144_0703 [Bacillus atrophaeus]
MILTEIKHKEKRFAFRHEFNFNFPLKGDFFVTFLLCVFIL